MKKILFTTALFFVAFIANAQEIEGKWSLVKMKFFGNTIYFDDSNKDKENLLNSWIKMNDAEKDPAVKAEITKSKDLIYDIAKKMFKSDIEFKDIKYEIYLEWTTGNLVYYDQKDETELEKKEVEIKLWHDENLKYKTITFPMYGDFHQSEKLKISLNGNKLVLEDIQKPGAGEVKTDAFVFYYERRSENANTNHSEKTINSSEDRDIVFNDDFSDNQNKWFEEETYRSSFKVIDGKYRVQSKLGGTWLSMLPIQFSTKTDFEIAARIRKVSGTNGYYFGIILGKKGTTGYHHFAGITGLGNYVFANKGAAPKDVIPSTENNTVVKGNASNYIVIKKEGMFIKLFINGRLMGETPFEEFYGDLFGFQIWSGYESLIIEVDKLTIKTIN